MVHLYLISVLLFVIVSRPLWRAEISVWWKCSSQS